MFIIHSFVRVQNNRFEIPNKTKSLFKGNVEVLQSVNILDKWWWPLKHTPNISHISLSNEFAAKQTLEKLSRYKKQLDNVKIKRNWFKTQVIKFLPYPSTFSTPSPLILSSTILPFRTQILRHLTSDITTIYAIMFRLHLLQFCFYSCFYFCFYSCFYFYFYFTKK